MDGQILLFIQDSIRNPVLTPITVFITRLGDAGIVWIIITLFLLFRRSTRKIGWMSAAALVIDLVICNLILKNQIARIRPYDVIDTLTPLVPKLSDYSFPSGHSAASFACAVVCFRNLPKKAGVPILILAVLISVSRLYVGVHYPTDVLGGIVIGIISAFLGEWVIRRIDRRKLHHE